MQVLGRGAGVIYCGQLDEKVRLRVSKLQDCKCWVECFAKLARDSRLKPEFIVVDDLDIMPSPYRNKGTEPSAC